MNLFNQIKEQVTARQVAESYGLTVGRNGMACCPFHDDNSPSARVYKNNFLCASENLHLNYFDFIRKYFNLAEDEAVKKKMKELKKSAKIKS